MVSASGALVRRDDSRGRALVAARRVTRGERSGEEILAGAALTGSVVVDCVGDGTAAERGLADFAGVDDARDAVFVGRGFGGNPRARRGRSRAGAAAACANRGARYGASQ